MSAGLSVLYEDNHLLVVDKPAGLPTVGVSESETSLAKMAKAYLKQKYRKPGNVYVGVVSRLDALVSGAIVLARTSKAAARLSDQFRSGDVRKRYFAIVEGSVAPQQNLLSDYLVKDDAAHRMRIAVLGGQRAELRYRVLGRSDDQTLLEIDLITGRKHQIRLQLSSRGWPIVGDRKYGSGRKFPRGIALHCVSLRFGHPTRKEPIDIYSPPPDYWELNRFPREKDASRASSE